MQQYMARTHKRYIQEVGGTERTVEQMIFTFTGKVKHVSEEKKSKRYGSMFATAIAEMAPGRDVIVVGREDALKQVLALKKNQVVVFDGRPQYQQGKTFFALETATVIKKGTKRS